MHPFSDDPNLFRQPAFSLATPPRRTAVKSTPQSMGAGSRSVNALQKERVSVVESFLKQDIRDRVIVSLDQFLATVLDIPISWKSDVLLSELLNTQNSRFSSLLHAYENKCKEKGDEEKLYAPFAKLCNAAFEVMDATSEARPIFFYRQDPNIVEGSHMKRKPDIGYLEKSSIQRALTDSLIERGFMWKVHWPLLLHWIEMKKTLVGTVLDRGLHGGCLKLITGAAHHLLYFSLLILRKPVGLPPLPACHPHRTW